MQKKESEPNGSDLLLRNRRTLEGVDSIDMDPQKSVFMGYTIMFWKEL